MITVLYVNHNHSKICGIHDLGVRHSELLSTSPNLLVCYAACNSVGEYHAAYQACQPDAVIINFRADLMPWVTQGLASTHVPKFAVIHNYEQATVQSVTNGHLWMGFNYAIALDPGLQITHPQLFATGRPIPRGAEHAHIAHRRPVIGSFGFAFPHKNFHGVAAEIDECLDSAVYTLHMPEAFFNGVGGGQLYTEGILAACRAAITKPTIELQYTGSYLDERATIRRLAENDVNCLFYVPGQPDAGLSSAIDYLIAARRPILVSDCAMFSHVRDRVALWPTTRLSDIMSDYDAYQRRAIDLYDDMAGRVVHDTVQMLKQVLG